jgi:isoleucyl-tRNA synthetase
MTFIFIPMNDNKPKSVNDKELETLLFWQENHIFEQSVTTPAQDKPKGSYSFYDGPPFATGLPHHGSLMAGTVKDVIPRYQTMKGNSVRRVWGWDCHGLPIENLIEKKLGLKSKKDIENFGIEKFNRDAYESVLQYEAEWKKIIPRLGRWVDMDHPYKTMDATYTESIWWAWKTLYTKGLAYEGSKMMHICPRCETPLAQSEVGLEYHDVTDISVTAKFELVDEPGTYVLAWTTTPWTLPGNTALAVNNNIAYVKVKSIFEGVTNYFILAKSKVEEYFKDSESKEIVEEFAGDVLVGKKYKPVFPYFVDKELDNKENIWKIWHADFITEDAGTGIAHEAPAFGAEDMDLAKANNIPIIKHVKMDGTFTSDVIDFAGMKVKQKDDTQSADIEIIKWLAHNGKLFEKHKIIHSYPLCWRCKTPLLNYATSSWFVDVPKMKEKLLQENSKIGWTPEHIRDGRFGKWLEGAREWAVSRSRFWGAPLPVWKNDKGEVHIVGSLKELAELSTKKAKNTYYIMRHAEALSNEKGILDTTGDPENHLTEKGKLQAKESAEALKKEKNIDLIVASPFLRAQETAHIVADILGVQCVTEEKLREYNMGVFDAKLAHEYLNHYGTDYLKLDTKPEGGESHRDMMNRSMKALYELEEMYDGKTILIITHGGPARMMFLGGELLTEELVLEDEKAHETKLYLENAEVRKLDLQIVPRDETGAVNLHRPYIDEVMLQVGGELYTRIQDVFDCWFESGSMPFASLHYPFENKEVFDKNYPADFIAEGMDQTRGWFYSLINLGVGLFDKAPYKHVICTGLINAADGKKLSKSLGNYTDPLALIEKYGADAFRYYLMSSPVVKGEGVNFDDKELEDIYKKCVSRLDNVVQLYAMNRPEVVIPKNTSSHVLDMWMVSRVHELIRDSSLGYDAYKLDEATRGISGIIDDISVWYTRRSRDRLKGDTGSVDQMRAYETLTYILQELAKVMAPVMPFIAERVYKAVGGQKESVHLESWPENGLINTEVIISMKQVRDIVSEVLMKRNTLNIPVRQPLAALTVSSELSDGYLEIVKDEVNVKSIVRGDELLLDTMVTPELQAEGDVRNLIRAIQDARKHGGLLPKDEVILMTTYSIPEAHKDELMKTCNVAKVVEGTGDYKAEMSTGAVLFNISKL